MTTKQEHAMKQAQTVLRGLTYTDSKVTAALEALHRALADHMSKADEGWQELPQRLRGRGDSLREIGRINDAELMYDAASEIEDLRSRKG